MSYVYTSPVVYPGPMVLVGPPPVLWRGVRVAYPIFPGQPLPVDRIAARSVPSVDVHRHEFRETCQNRKVQDLSAKLALSNQSLEDAVWAAVRADQLPVVESLLQKKMISVEMRGNCVVHAAKKRQIEIVKCLLMNGPISNSACKEALKAAILGSDLAVMHSLFSTGLVSLPMRKHALFFAARNGKIEGVRFLLQEGAISLKARSMCVLKAASGGHLDVVKALLANGEEISEEGRLVAVCIADLNGNIGIFNELMKRGPFCEVESGEVLSKAALMPYPRNVASIMKNGAVSEYWCRAAGLLAVNADNHKVIWKHEVPPYVFSKEAISQDEERGFELLLDPFLDVPLLIEAAGNREFKKVQDVLEKVVVPVEIFDDAVWAAVRSNQLPVVEALLQKQKISVEMRGICVVHAAKNKQNEIFKCLLMNGPISKSACDEALKATTAIPAEDRIALTGLLKQ